MNAEADAVMIRGELTGSRSLPRALEAPQADWLQPMRTDWPTAVCRRLERSSVVVRVLVAEVLGSAPREAGACMLVTREGIEGTIGGGNLEWRAIESARGLLARDVEPPAARLDRLTLGRELAQCCGGVVQLWIERFTRADLPILRRAAVAANSGVPASMMIESSATGVMRTVVGDAYAKRESAACAMAAGGLPSASRDGRVRLTSSSDGRITLIERIDVACTPVCLYGAGHVGQALVRTLAELPYDVTWVDPRADLFPQTLPGNVTVLSAPLDAAISAPRAARHLVMTHDHALDYELCRAILARDEFATLGLIGSESKAARFRSRLKRDGIALERIARLVCPIGLTDIRSKSPAAIAIGIAAQLLRETGEAESRRELSSSNADDCNADRCSSCQRSHR